MESAPGWWYGVSGAFFAVGILFSLVLTAVLVLLVGLLRKLSGEIHQLVGRVNALTEKVDGLLVHAREVTQSVGGQATHAASNLARLSGGIAGKVEMAAAVFMILGALQGYLRGRRQSRK